MKVSEFVHIKSLDIHVVDKESKTYVVSIPTNEGAFK